MMLEHVKGSCLQNKKKILSLFSKKYLDEAAKPPNKDCFDSSRLPKNLSQEITFNDEQLAVLFGGWKPASLLLRCSSLL